MSGQSEAERIIALVGYIVDGTAQSDRVDAMEAEVRERVVALQAQVEQEKKLHDQIVSGYAIRVGELEAQVEDLQEQLRFSQAREA